MTQIKELMYITPIISLENVKEYFRQSQIIHNKTYGFKMPKNSIARHISKCLNEHYYRPSIGGCVSNYLDNRIVLNLNNLKNMGISRTEEIFLKRICSTLTHETIHLVLQLNEGSIACNDFDNIYNKYPGYGFTLWDLK
jgi:hypothetical protein